MKINIVGLAGSGKTTLAKKLTKLHNLEHFNLDYVIYRPIEGTHKRLKVSENEYKKVINQFAVKSNWVIEGIFVFEDILKRADIIIWIRP